MLYFVFSVALFCKNNSMFIFWAAVANGVVIFKPKKRILTWENPSQYLLSVYWCTRVTRFLRSHLTSKSFVKCSMCSYQGRGRAGSVPEILVSRREILPYEHFSPVSGMNSGGPDDIVLHCLLYFPHPKHPIDLQWCSFKSCRSYDRRES